MRLSATSRTQKIIEFRITNAKEAMQKESWQRLGGRYRHFTQDIVSLAHAISTYHDGFKASQGIGQQPRIGRNKWRDLDYTIQQAKQAMQKEGWKTLPGIDVLSIGYSSLATAIFKYHGRIKAFRSLLGQESLHGRWKSLDYTIEQALSVMKKHGWQELPGANVLNAEGYSSISSAIYNYHGGFPKFRGIIATRLGQPYEWKERAKRGTCRFLRYSINQARQAMREHDWPKLPGEPKLMAHGYSALSSIISKYHGTVEFRALLGQEDSQALWQDIQFRIRVAQRAMCNEGWPTLPGSNTMQKAGYGRLNTAIKKYDGSLPAFREAMAKAQGLPSEKEHLEALLGEYVGAP